MLGSKQKLKKKKQSVLDKPVFFWFFDEPVSCSIACNNVCVHGEQLVLWKYCFLKTVCQNLCSEPSATAV